MLLVTHHTLQFCTDNPIRAIAFSIISEYRVKVVERSSLPLSNTVCAIYRGYVLTSLQCGRVLIHCHCGNQGRISLSSRPGN